MPLTAFITGIATKTSASIVGNYVKEKGETFFGSDKTNFTKELENVIYKTIEEFDKQYNIPDEGQKFAFYKSDILIQTLLTIKFLGRDTIDTNELTSQLGSNPNIISPKIDEINKFLNLFEEKCTLNQALRKHQFNDNYKEAIFKVLESFDSFNSTLNKIFSEIKASLKAEYAAQLDEIQENINCFKPKTALERLESLEKRIIQNSLMTPEIESQLLYLKGTCIIDSDKDRSGAELIVRAYLINKTRLLKTEAALAYYNLQDPKSAKELADEILKGDPFNVIAWIVLILLADRKYQDVLKKVPQAVKNKRGFAASIIRHLRINFQIPFAELKSLDLSLPRKVDDKITHTNKVLWEIVSEVLLSEFFESSGEHGFDNEGKISYLKKEGLSDLILILDKFFDAIKGTEIQGNFPHLRFYYFFIRHLKGDNSFDKNEFKAVYLKLKDLDFFYDLHFAEFLADTKDVKGALDVISQSKFQSNEFLSLHRIYYNLVIGEKEEAFRLLQKHVEALQKIGFESIYNIANFYKLFIAEKHNLREQYERTLANKTFESPEIKELFEIIISTYFFSDEIKKDEVSEKLIHLGKHFASQPKIVFYISEVLFNLKSFEKCIELIEALTESGVQSKINLLYAHALFSSKTRLSHLLKFLQEIRTKNENNIYDFLALEFNLRRDISDWDSILDISQRGIRLYPSSENFHLNLLTALEHKEQKEQIKEYVQQYYRDNFKNEQIGIYVSATLMRSGFLKEAALLLYNMALNPSNHIARVNYVTFIKFPEGFIIDYDSVEKGSFVKLSDLSGKIIKLIKTDKEDKYNLVGKKLGDKVLIPEKVGIKMTELFVARIMNDHLFLLEEILYEAKDANSELPLEGFNFSNEDGSLDIEGLNKYFIEKFGVEEKLHREYVQKLMQSYNNGQESFGDIARQIFNEKLLECYQALTYQGFYVLPSFHNARLSISGAETFAIDFTALILLSELKDKKEIVIDKKFVISPFLTILLKNELVKLQAFPTEKMKLTVIEESVRPIFYPENYNENQIEILNRLLLFIKDHCIEKVIEEKVDLFSEKLTKIYDDNFMQYQVDNAIFCSTLGYTLVSNDTFLLKYFANAPFKQISPENFLMRILGNNYSKEIINYYVEHNYIGVNINTEVLLREYKNHQLSKANYFLTCIMNLKFRTSLSPNNIITGIKFLKEVYVSNLALDNEKFLLAQSIFTNLLDGCSSKERIIQIIRIGIYSEFNLMGKAFDAVSDAFETTLNMYQGRR